MAINKRLSLLIGLLASTLYLAILYVNKPPHISIACHYGLSDYRPFTDPYCTSHDLDGRIIRDFRSVADLFRENLNRGWDVGASVTGIVAGHEVVRLYGGFHLAKYMTAMAATEHQHMTSDQIHDASEHDRQQYSDSTLQQVFGAGQLASSISIALLVDRGALQYEQPIARYWADFAQHGKENITVQQLMMHQSGLVLLDFALTRDIVDDAARLASLLAAQKPLWPTPASPTTPRQAHHTVTRELYVSELIRRVDSKGRDLARFFDDEIAVKLNIDMYIGLPHIDELLSRVSPLYGVPAMTWKWNIGMRMLLPHWLSDLVYPTSQLWSIDAVELDAIGALAANDRSSLLNRSMRQVHINGRPWFEQMLERQFLSLPLASINTYATSHALATLASVMVQDGATPLGCGTQQLLRPETVRQALHLPNAMHSVFDETLRINITYTRGGFGAFDDGSFGWGGIGGSIGVWHPEYALAFGYVSNQLGLRYPHNVCQRLNYPRLNCSADWSLVIGLW
jgi:CubicO group peptidase (beta-lactamase class C family)